MAHPTLKASDRPPKKGVKAAFYEHYGPQFNDCIGSSFPKYLRARVSFTTAPFLADGARQPKHRE